MNWPWPGYSGKDKIENNPESRDLAYNLIGATSYTCEMLNSNSKMQEKLQ